MRSRDEEKGWPKRDGVNKGEGEGDGVSGIKKRH